MLIYRELLDYFLSVFTSTQQKGVILAGIVGSGKTTLIREALKTLKVDYEIFEYTGDDVRFRNNILTNSKLLHENIRSQTTKRALIFVDEVQKCEEIFDAIKYAFDHSNASFIVSGSNPAYLNSAARKRLQRRADFIELLPFSLPELLLHSGFIQKQNLNIFQNFFSEKILSGGDVPENFQLNFDLEQSSKLEHLISRYLILGGIPLSYLSTTQNKGLIEVRNVVERGFELLSVSDDRLSETIKIELAALQSQEFTYKNIMHKTGIRRREIINETIDELINHGYLVRKKPTLFDEDRRSYLTVYSYVDPGIVTYLTGQDDIQKVRGSRIEGIIHARLNQILQHIPLKLEISYFKPHTKDSDGKIKYFSGEIDFIVRKADEYIPIEVKSTNQISQIDTMLISEFIKKHQSKIGIILYGGLPYWDAQAKLLYFPFWLV